MPYRRFPGDELQYTPDEIAGAHLAKQTGAFESRNAAAINKITTEHPKPTPTKKEHADHRAHVAKQRRVEKPSHRKTDRR